MKAVITNTTEVRQDYTQEVSFDVVEGDSVMLSHTMTGDVDNLKNDIKDFLKEYRRKVTSANKLEINDEISVSGS